MATPSFDVLLLGLTIGKYYKVNQLNVTAKGPEGLCGQ